MVAGAVAAFRYRAEPRFTTDLDLLVTWDDGLPAAALAAGYAVDVKADEGEAPHLILLRRGSERIDLLVASTAYQELAVERGRREHVLTVEDVIVHKLIAWRARDRDDIASILSAGHALDGTYIRQWATAWAVGDRWEQVQRWPTAHA